MSAKRLIVMDCCDRPRPKLGMVLRRTGSTPLYCESCGKIVGWIDHTWVTDDADAEWAARHRECGPDCVVTGDRCADAEGTAAVTP